jgi:hypothetical protein
MARVKWLPPTPYPPPGSLPQRVGGTIWLVSSPSEHAWRTRAAWLEGLSGGWGGRRDIQRVLQAVGLAPGQFGALTHSCGARGSVVVKALCYKLKGRGLKTG